MTPVKVIYTPNAEHYCRSRIEREHPILAGSGIGDKARGVYGKMQSSLGALPSRVGVVTVERLVKGLDYHRSRNTMNELGVAQTTTYVPLDVFEFIEMLGNDADTVQKAALAERIITHAITALPIGIQGNHLDRPHHTQGILLSVIPQVTAILRDLQEFLKRLSCADERGAEPKRQQVIEYARRTISTLEDTGLNANYAQRLLLETEL